jgi:hypothetical protein
MKGRTDHNSHGATLNHETCAETGNYIAPVMRTYSNDDNQPVLGCMATCYHM